MPRAISLAAVLAAVFSASFLASVVRPEVRRPRPLVLASSAAPPAAPELPPRPVRVETVSIENDLPGFVLHAAQGAVPGPPMLFVPGMCVHPVGYVEAFQGTAAARGDLVALQGDVSCGGDGFARKWSADLEAMNRRIEEVFRASGLGEPRDVTVIGYSQGAERAERLVTRWPDRYARAVLIASPVVPSPSGLARSKGIVLMAGTFDTQTSMRGAVVPLRRAGVPSTFVELPGARHGQMGTDPGRVMGQALDFLHENKK